MGKLDDLFDELRSESKSRNIFSPIPAVPSTRQMRHRADLAKVWPSQSGAETTMTQNLQKLWKLESRYSWRQVWALEQHNKIFTILNTASCYHVGHIFCRTVKLTGGLAKINIMLPMLLGSNVFNFYLHTKNIHLPIAYEPYQDHTPLAIESIGYQLINGFLYPLLFVPVSAIYFAARSYTFPVPDDLFRTRETRQYLFETVYRQTIRRNRASLIVMLLANITVPAAVTLAESTQMRMMYEDLTAN